MNGPPLGGGATPAELPQLKVANANFITNQIAFGGDLAASFKVARTQLDELLNAGITHIVDLRSEWSDEVLVRGWAPEIKYLNHRIEDAGQLIDPEWFDELISWVDAAFTDPNAKVLVHCHMGVNRAPSATLALLLHQGMGLREALELIRATRPVAVIDYAGSVLTWYLGRTDADPRTRRNLRRVLIRWRQSHHVDAAGVIREIRSQENPNSRWLVRLGPNDPDTLGRVLAESGEVAVGLNIDRLLDDLGQLDEVLFITELGLTGRALVVGPSEEVKPGSVVLPVMITDLFRAVPVQLPPAVEEWFAEQGPNPMSLNRHDYRKLTSRNS